MERSLGHCTGHVQPAQKLTSPRCIARSQIVVLGTLQEAVGLDWAIAGIRKCWQQGTNVSSVSSALLCRCNVATDAALMQFCTSLLTHTLADIPADMQRTS